MKEIPDFNIELSQAMDYIMGSDLAQKAFDNPPFMHYTNVLRAPQRITGFDLSSFCK